MKKEIVRPTDIREVGMGHIGGKLLPFIKVDQGGYGPQVLMYLSEDLYEQLRAEMKSLDRLKAEYASLFPHEFGLPGEFKRGDLLEVVKMAPTYKQGAREDMIKPGDRAAFVEYVGVVPEGKLDPVIRVRVDFDYDKPALEVTYHRTAVMRTDEGDEVRLVGREKEK
ncbi:MAG: hypothetical protein JRN62_03205 [Nitrososphaerota archaeon]|jgi:hypothetical protein|nr:hypothetical protein [Nitrososphaerota archaeon]MDG6948605.1 hypothetical protein [Nitrososphaerota archaeon]